MMRAARYEKLFHYTTLFRSKVPAGRTRGGERRRQSSHAGRTEHGGQSLPAAPRPAGQLAALLPEPPLALVDRKSTRLNSSHRCISYAVFCLKKITMITFDML